MLFGERLQEWEPMLDLHIPIIECMYYLYTKGGGFFVELANDLRESSLSEALLLILDMCYFTIPKSNKDQKLPTSHISNALLCNSLKCLKA